MKPRLLIRRRPPRSSPAPRAFWARTWPICCWRAGTRSSASTISSPARWITSAHLGGNPSFKFIEQDVTEFIFLDVPVDYVWHFASPASPIDYLELPIQTLKVGSLGTHKALGLAKNKHARFLLASTSEIYGDPLVHPQPEEYWGNVNPDRPARLLRRGQALRRSPHDGLPPRAPGRDPHRAHLQHLRAAHALARWPRGARLHQPGAQGPPADRVRRAAARPAASVTCRI